MNLRTFIDQVEQEGRLVRVARPVDVVHETAAVIRMLKGKPVIFEQVKGHSMPVISNVCSSRDLVCLGLGISRKDLIPRLVDAARNPKQPEVVKAEGYQEVEANLTGLPILTYYSKDGGPYIASGIAVAKDPEYGINASFHRAQVIGEDKLAMRIVERHLHRYLERGLREFAFCIGNPIPMLVAGAMSVELGKSELAVANALSETQLVELNGHLVPQSEIVMICEFTGEKADEGPFLDLTETFDVVRKQPVTRVKGIFKRADSLFHALLPGDFEHKILMGMPREPTIFSEVSKVCECLDVNVTPGGCSWLHAAVKIRKENAEDGKRAIEAAFKGHASMKHVFVVDEDIDIEDPVQMEWAMATRFQADRDMIIKKRQKGSSLDPSSDVDTKQTTKVGFDLTVPDLERPEKFRRAEPSMPIKLQDFLCKS